jgi:hypothetical protein
MTLVSHRAEWHTVVIETGNHAPGVLPMTTTFTTIYRTGGTEKCVWKRCLPVLTAEAAAEQAAQIERMGYRAIVHRTHMLDAIGMPEGWAA